MATQHEVIAFLKELGLGHSVHSSENNWSAATFIQMQPDGAAITHAPVLRFVNINTDSTELILRYTMRDFVHLVDGPMQWNHPRLKVRIAKMQRYIIACEASYEDSKRYSNKPTG